MASFYFLLNDAWLTPESSQKIRELTQDVNEIRTFLTKQGTDGRNKDEEAAGIPCVPLLKQSFKFIFTMN